MNCWFWVWFLHFSFWNLLEIFFSLPRGVVLSRNQIAAIGLPESWVQLSSWSCWTTLMARILAIKSLILLLFCPSDVKTCHAWKMLESNKRNKRKRKKKSNSSGIVRLKKIARAKKEAGVFSHFSRLCWMLELNLNAFQDVWILA